MRGKDPDRYIENLEEIIISKDRLIDKLRRSAAFTDIALSVLPHISLLNHWTICALKEVTVENCRGEKRASTPDGAQSAQSDESRGITAGNPILDIERYASISAALSRTALRGMWYEAKGAEGGNLNETIILWSRRFDMHTSRKGPVHLKLSLGNPPPANMNEAGLFRIVNSIASNALEALHGRDNPAVIIRTSAERKRIVLEIEDNGPGIPEAISSRILAPYFTTKSGKHGQLHHGLGLHSVVKILDSVNGKLEFESIPGSFTLFRVSIPIFESEGKLLELKKSDPNSLKKHGR